VRSDNGQVRHLSSDQLGSEVAMSTTPMAHHVCQRCGRSGTREFVNVGTGGWECTDDTACRNRSIQAARRQKAVRAALTELPTLLGGGTVDTNGDKAWYEIDTGAFREAVVVEYHPNEDHPFQVWVRSWGPDYRLTSESEAGAFNTSAEAAKEVSTILADIATSDRLHAELPGEGYRECEGPEPSSYPSVVDVEHKKKSWPTA